MGTSGRVLPKDIGYVDFSEPSELVDGLPESEEAPPLCWKMLQKLVSDKGTAATLGDAFSSTLGYPPEDLVGLMKEKKRLYIKGVAKVSLHIPAGARGSNSGIGF